MSRTLGAALACTIAAVTPAAAQDFRPGRDVMVPMPPTAPTPAGASTNVIFLNRCVGGCQVSGVGSDDGTHTPNAYSSIANGTLSAYASDDAHWNQIVACMKDVFADFNVLITDQRPTGDYLTVMVAGTAAQVGQGQGVGGVAPFRCQTFSDRTLVFAFANEPFYGNGTNVEEICATAAQEIAHTWALDHSTDAADPMTYFGYSGRRYYANSAQVCGSDCVNGRGPFGQTCTGPNVGNSGPQQHSCSCNSGSMTQNTYQTVMSLFGPGTPTPPTVKITNPMNGQAVQPGFNVTATVSSVYGTANKADLYVDGNLVLTLTSQPFAFNAPDNLAPGAHDVKVIGYDNHGMTTADITVIIGMPCQKPSDCPSNTDTCVGGRCVAGPGVQGGLGTTCTQSTMCASGQCASDGTNMYCVEPCMPGQCPSGFGCEPLGSGSDMSGVCWPGYNDGHGGCSSSSGPIGLGLGFAVLVLVRRRRR